MDSITLLHGYATFKGLKRRYVSLVCTSSANDAKLIFFESEAKWSASNPPPSVLPDSPQYPLSCWNGIDASPSSLILNGSMGSFYSSSTCSSSDAAQLGLRVSTASVVNGIKLPKFEIPLDGLFYVGVSHSSNKPSVTAAIKNVFSKFLPIKKQHKQPQPLTRSLSFPKSTDLQTDSYMGNASLDSMASASPLHCDLLNSATRPASIHWPCDNTISTSSSPSSSSTKLEGGQEQNSLGLYFDNGSSYVMSFAKPDILGIWLQAFSAVVAANRLWSSFPHIEYVSTVTCKFKAKEFNSGPFPKIKGQYLFCMSKLDVLLVSKNIKNPDLSIRFPYVRQCASRDDGRLCLDIGRASPMGECELVLHMSNAKEAKFAHSRCITLMRQCPTWLKLGRNGPSSRRRPIPNFRKKASEIKLAGPPLPRFPTMTTSEITPKTDDTVTSTDAECLTTSLFSPQDVAVSVHSSSLCEVFLSQSLSCSSPIHPSLPPLVNRPRQHQNKQRWLCPNHSLLSKSYSFPFRLHDESIPELQEHNQQHQQQQTSNEPRKPASAPVEKRYSLTSCLNEVKEEEVEVDLSTKLNERLTSSDQLTPNNLPSTETKSVEKNGCSPSPSDHYLQLTGGTGNLMGGHIKSITKFLTLGGNSVEEEEKPSAEQIHKVLTFLATIARPATEIDRIPPPPPLPPGPSQSCSTSSSNNNSSCASSLRLSVGSNSFRNPLLMLPSEGKFIEQPWHPSGGSRGFDNSEGIYVDTMGSTNGSEQITISSRSGCRKSGVSLPNTSSSIIIKPVQLRRGPKWSTVIGGSQTYSQNGSVSGSKDKDKDISRTRIYSHRENDEIFADLNYTSRRLNTRSFIAPETGRRGIAGATLLEDFQEVRPRTASDTSHWVNKKKNKAPHPSPTNNLPLNNRTLQNILASVDYRPRAQSLTTQQIAVAASAAAAKVSRGLGREGSIRESTVTADSRSLDSTRSNSSTSGSKSIMRAIEHALGRPRSTGEREVHSPVHADSNNSRPLLSEIYAEMDFTPSNTIPLVDFHRPSAPQTVPKASLLVTPSDSLSSTSSSCGLVVSSPHGGWSNQKRVVKFSDHYSLFNPSAPTITNSSSPAAVLQSMVAPVLSTPTSHQPMDNFLRRLSHLKHTSSANMLGCEYGPTAQ